MLKFEACYSLSVNIFLNSIRPISMMFICFNKFLKQIQPHDLRSRPTTEERIPHFKKNVNKRGTREIWEEREEWEIREARGKKERNGIEEGKIGKIFVYAVYTLSRNTAEGQVCLRHYP